MNVAELLAEVVTMLQKEGRLSYRLLKGRFDLADEYLEDLKAELIDANGGSAGVPIPLANPFSP